ncbi:MAG TPA: hypothetical protein VNS34_08910 [Rhizobiaceae bacterium]|nr:hypothetical protein [Rhizobiaceae bacterium]
MNTKALLSVAIMAFGIAGCGEQEASSPTPQASGQDAPVDRDPTPQTGTGGESQTSNPNGTTTGGTAPNN